MEPDDSPISPALRLQAAPRCTAKAKRSGVRCKCPAVKGWTVCRVHGARGGHGPGPLNPAYRHGGRTREAEALRRMFTALAREGRKAAQMLDNE